MRQPVRALFLCGLVGLAAGSSPQLFGALQEPSPLEVTLAKARVSVLDGGRVVVSFDAAGDVRGLLTLTIDRDASGSLSGEWVLVSRYLQDLNPDGTPREPDHHGEAEDPHDEEDGHHEYVEIRERGTLRGAIAGGTLALAAGGELIGIDGLQLAIAGGDIEFAGATGSGTASASNFLAEAGGTGALSLAVSQVQH